MSTPVRGNVAPAQPATPNAPGAAVAVPATPAPEVHAVSTPRALRLLRALTVLACLAAAVLAPYVLVRTSSNLETISSGTQQALRLHTIKGDILRADGLALNGLAQGDAESDAQREAYRYRLATAAHLTLAAGAAGTASDQPALANANAALVTYAANLELARTTVLKDGTKATSIAAVDRSTSSLRDAALPILDGLIDATDDRVANAKAADRLWAVPLAAVPLLFVLLTAIVMARRTKRVLNLGLLVAAVAAIALWRLVDTGLGDTAHIVDETRAGSLSNATAAADAYVALNDAKSIESRSLLSPAQASSYTARWTTAMNAALEATDRLSATERDEVRTQIAAYRREHDQLITVVKKAEPADIVKQAGASRGVNATFQTAADSLATLAERYRGETETQMSERRDALVRSGALSVALALAVALATTLGVGARLREFR